MAENLKFLGEIEKITDTYIDAIIKTEDSDYATPVRFPRSVMNKTNIELRFGNFFYWEPSKRPSSAEDINPDEFYPADDINRFPSQPENLQEMLDQFSEDVKNGLWDDEE